MMIKCDDNKMTEKNRIIDLGCLETYPQELIDLLKSNRCLFSKCLTNVLINQDIEQSFEPIKKSILNKADDILKGSYIMGFHIARVCDDTIAKIGLKKLSNDYYLNYMRSVFIDKLQYSEKDTEDYIKMLESKMNSEIEKGRKCLSLFYPKSEYVLNEKDNGYLHLYGDYVGGEIAKMTFLNCDKVHNDLHNLGKISIIKTVFPYDSLTIHTEYPKDYVQKEILYFLSCLIFNGRLPYNALFLAQVDCDIPRENILEIQKIEQ